jgi:hypothetical protein
MQEGHASVCAVCPQHTGYTHAYATTYSCDSQSHGCVESRLVSQQQNLCIFLFVLIIIFIYILYNSGRFNVFFFSSLLSCFCIPTFSFWRVRTREGTFSLPFFMDLAWVNTVETTLPLFSVGSGMVLRVTTINCSWLILFSWFIF